MEDERFAFIFDEHWGDLRKLTDKVMMQSSECPPFGANVTCTFMTDIARGMHKLHKLGILHNDLKAANVLVLNRAIKRGFWEGSLEVADFESSVGIGGTGFWRAPEVILALKNGNLKQETFTQQTDVYSFAMTCYEILTGRMPFEDYDYHDYDIVLRGERPTLPQDPSYHELNNLVRRCWHHDPQRRPLFEEICVELKDTLDRIVEKRPYLYRIL